MRSYRFSRRAFLAGIGGAVGLDLLLRNLEAAAQGTPPPPRFLMTHWPVGTVKYHFRPSGSGTDFTSSRILKPFETAGLRDDLIVIWGLNGNTGSGQGGGHEAGTPMATTGAPCPGTRKNGGEEDDACAGGPSFDQIFLKHVPALQRSGIGYANAICDARVDSLETSTQCLSYGYTTRSIAAARPANTNITENVPLLPELSPTQLYMRLFTGFMPGGDTDANREQLLRGLRARKSVLDYSLSQLATIKTLAPAAEAPKIDAHAEAIRKVEQQVSEQILAGGDMGGASCAVPPAPDPALTGKTGSRNDYGRPETNAADDTLHEQIGKLHASILIAAFQCDIIRVATFQWSPGTNHVSFKGQFPDDPNAIYMHHPLSHRILDRAHVWDSPPSSGELQSIVEFLSNVQTWYNQKTADILVQMKEAVDVFGGSLLDYTIVPYITEVAETTHSWSPKPAMIFGGSKLGMRGGQYLDFDARPRPHNDLWMTIAQAYLGTSDPLPEFDEEVFVKQGVAPIPGCWEPPSG